jgi:WD40 repeat protein
MGFIWDKRLSSESPRFFQETGFSACAHVPLAPSGERGLSAGDGPVDLWDMRSGKRLHTLLGRKGQGVRVAISPDAKTVASVGPARC